MPNGDSSAVWLKLLDSLEASAKHNKDGAQAVSSSLKVASEALQSSSEALKSLHASASQAADVQEMRFQVKQLETQVAELSAESKANKVGKDDLVWKVLVGFFALVATGLGTALVSMVMNKGG
tara:strand:- start:24 stop:392 length:369 start_codon:yes stop_codon:yes gene_type:complete